VERLALPTAKIIDYGTSCIRPPSASPLADSRERKGAAKKALATSAERHRESA
jgi:hypothetical protein